VSLATGCCYLVLAGEQPFPRVNGQAPTEYACTSAFACNPLYLTLLFFSLLPSVGSFTQSHWYSMRTSLYLFVGGMLLLGSGCQKDPIAAPDRTCADEHTLATYQNQEAVVVQTELDTYCLVVDSTAIAQNSFPLAVYLVPVPATALPAQYRVPGLHVRLDGLKQSCYGLTTLPNLRTPFGYKLKLTAVKASQ
jgi:hypothetical protein